MDASAGTQDASAGTQDAWQDTLHWVFTTVQSHILQKIWVGLIKLVKWRKQNKQTKTQ